VTITFGSTLPHAQGRAKRVDGLAQGNRIRNL
jgi:hypothetical protein